jgi:hypothetical protein
LPALKFLFVPAVHGSRYDVAASLRRRPPSLAPTSPTSSTPAPRKVHKRSTAAQPFKKEAAQRALEKVDILSDLMTLWRQASR